MDKLYERINWENEPSVSSPINATNLNKIDYAVDELDNRVISLDTTKISKAETASDVVDVSLDEDTGIFTFTRRDGSTIQFDTKLEKVAVNWTYDSETEKLVLTLDDGTTQEVDLSKLITVYEFLDSDTIAFSINSAGKVVAIVKNGAITEEHLAFDYLGEIKVESAKAETASASASVSAQEAKQYRDEAKTFRDETEAFAPDGYDELKQQVAENSARIDAVIELSAFQIQNTASGSPIHLTDSANGKNVGFGLYGKAEQKQYSGKNLVEGIDTTFAIGNTVEKIIVNSIHLMPGTYTLSWVQDVNLVSNTRNTPTYGTVSNYEATKKYQATVGNGNLNAGRYSWTITIEEENDYRFSYWMHSPSAEVTISDIQLESGSVMTDFEPYVGGIASPNPDYPQEITVSGSDGSVEVVICGKNLLKNLASSHVYNGITFTVNDDDGSVTANGTSTGDIWVNLTGANSVKLDLDGNYILSGCPIGGSVSKYALTAVDRGTDDAKDVSVYRDEGKGVNVLFDSTHYYKIFIRVYSGATLNNLTYYPMIRLASDTDSTYQPYTETTSTIPTPDGLCGIKVSSGGNYVDENGQQWLCDEVVKYADGSGKRIQRIGKAVFDGSDDEAWNYNNQYFYSDVISSQNANEKNNFMCNRFNVVDVNTSIMVRDNTIGLRTNFVAINYAEITNISDFKTWLASNNTIVLYELAEPIITDLSAEEIAEIEKLYTFYPVTNISNDADCGMSITYMADAKNYIDNRLALIESAMLNNI